jgi:hypothetical protein
MQMKYGEGYDSQVHPSEEPESSPELTKVKVHQPIQAQQHERKKSNKVSEPKASAAVKEGGQSSVYIRKGFMSKKPSSSEIVQ